VARLPRPAAQGAAARRRGRRPGWDDPCLSEPNLFYRFERAGR
jgi:hypothetical protein